MSCFMGLQSSTEQSKGQLWDISEEEDESPVSPTKVEELDLLISTTLAETKEEDNLPQPPLVFPEKDIFGRESPKNKSAWKYRPENYGKVYNLMTGLEVGIKRLDCEVMKSASQASYLEKLHECECTENINFCTPSLCKPQVDPTYKHNAIFRPPSDYCFRTTPGYEFQLLTTFDIQSVICAMLNSKVRLLWLIGAEADGKITGCHMTYSDRDCLRQGADFALSTEFLPALDPELVDIRFILIDPEYDPDLYLVEISLNTTVLTLYQLSSGRIFYNNGGFPTLLNSMNEARLMLLDRKRAQYFQLEKNDFSFKRIGTLRPNSNRMQHFGCTALAFTCGVALGYTFRRLL